MINSLPLGPSAKAVHSWSLFRTLGRYVATGSTPSGHLQAGGGGGLELLDLPAELRRHGYAGVQLCHFYLPTRDPGYLADLSAAFAEARVELECFLVDDGDLAHPSDGAQQQAWLSGWIEIGEALGAPRVRVPAGQQPPSPSTLAASANRLRELASRHTGVRLVVENWLDLLIDADSVNQLLDATGDEVGFLIDLGNWTGPDKYTQLAAVAARAETCQAKVRTDAAGVIDEQDFRTSLTVLRDADYTGPLALVYDGPDPDEWGHLEQAHAIASSVFSS